MRPFLACLAPLLLAASPPADSLHYVLDAAHTDIRARVAFLGLANQTVRFPQVSGRMELNPADIEAIELGVTLDARSLVAPDSLTQSRLKGPKFFDVAHYPQLRFIGRHFTMTGEKTAQVDGTMTARGITRDATLRITFSEPPASAGIGHPIKLNATMVIDRDDFGMTAYHFIVGRNVTVTIDATMVPGG